MRWCYVHLPRFPLQRRVLETPSLAGKPLVLSEEVRGAQRVVFASASAMKAGIRVGMTVASSTALVPQLVASRFEPLRERQALTSLGESLLALGPAFQLCPPDGLWLDGSAAALFGGEEGLSRRIRERARTHGYQAWVAIASEAFTSRAVAREKTPAPTGEGTVIAAEESQAALAALPLQALEPELEGSGVVGLFASLGLTTLGEVAALPPGAIVARLGTEGLRAHRLARGADDSPFTPEPVAEQLEESVSLDWPAEAIEPLLFALKMTLDRLCARLSGRRQAAVRLTFRLKLDPSGITDVALSLARPSAVSRLLLDLARHRIEDLTLENPVAGLVVRIDETCTDAGQQLSLGDEPNGDAALEVVLSRLTTRLGKDSLFSAEPVEEHRPERAYRTAAFRPPVREGAVMGGGAGARARYSAGTAAVDPLWVAEPDASSERPSRLFPQPQPLVTELGPSGELVAANLFGCRRRVLAVAGPERLGGHWWEEAPYAREYYRVHFEALGPVWLYRDARDGGFYLQGVFD